MWYNTYIDNGAGRSFATPLYKDLLKGEYQK